VWLPKPVVTAVVLVHAFQFSERFLAAALTHADECGWSAGPEPLAPKALRLTRQAAKALRVNVQAAKTLRRYVRARRGVSR
jgi:hypothetical protein